MIAALLGNGPSKESYLASSIKYDILVGCNVPFTTVDFTVVLDEEVIWRWAREPDLITVPTYFSEHAWRETDAIKKRPFFQQYFKGIVKPLPEYDTSGHVACSLLIKEGYKEIHVYGADVMFEDTLESASHKLFKNYPDLNSKAHMQGWRNRWNNLLDNNPNCSIIFKR
jgi:hypothetical protein